MFGRCATLPIDLNICLALPQQEATRFLGMQEPDLKHFAEKRAQRLEQAKPNIVAAQASRRQRITRKMKGLIVSRKGSLSSKRTLRLRSEGEASWRPDLLVHTSSKENFKEEQLTGPWGWQINTLGYRCTSQAIQQIQPSSFLQKEFSQMSENASTLTLFLLTVVYQLTCVFSYVLGYWCDCSFQYCCECWKARSWTCT